MIPRLQKKAVPTVFILGLEFALQFNLGISRNCAFLKALLKGPWEDTDPGSWFIQSRRRVPEPESRDATENPAGRSGHRHQMQAHGQVTGAGGAGNL